MHLFSSLSWKVHGLKKRENKFPLLNVNSSELMGSPFATEGYIVTAHMETFSIKKVKVYSSSESES